MVLFAGLVLVAMSCSAPGHTSAADRLATVTADGCGFAGPSTGSGVALGGDRVLTAAHVVASSSSSTITLSDGSTIAATVVALDADRDLALLAGEGLDIDELPIHGDVEAEALVTIVGRSSPDGRAATIGRRVAINIDAVRSTSPARRLGYEIAALTSPGDSGAAVYDRTAGLTGIVFAVSTADESRTWATASSEIRTFLDENAEPGHYRCDTERSRLVSG